MNLIRADRDAILRPLQMVSGIVERRGTLPILSHVLISKTGPQISLLSTDIEIQVRTEHQLSEGLDNVSTTVNAKKLVDILRSLPTTGEVELTLDQNKLHIRQAKTKFALQTLTAEEFPTVTEADVYPTRVVMRHRQLKRLIQLVHFSMASQDIRYYLNGMLLMVEATALRTVTTDGHRLAYAGLSLNQLPEDEAPTITTDTGAEVIIPRKAIMELQKLLEDTDDLVEISISPTLIKFNLGHIEILSKLIDGKFPDFQRVIPKSTAHRITVLREILLGSLQRAAIMTNDKFKGVRVKLTEHTMSISSNNAEQEEAHDELEVDYIGGEMEIGFNVQYLLDVLGNLKSTSVTLGLQDSNSSAVLTTESEPEFTYVVMPMRI